MRGSNSIAATSMPASAKAGARAASAAALATQTSSVPRGMCARTSASGTCTANTIPPRPALRPRRPRSPPRPRRTRHPQWRRAHRPRPARRRSCRAQSASSPFPASRPRASPPRPSPSAPLGASVIPYLGRQRGPSWRNDARRAWLRKSGPVRGCSRRQTGGGTPACAKAAACRRSELVGVEALDHLVEHARPVQLRLQPQEHAAQPHGGAVHQHELARRPHAAGRFSPACTFSATCRP